MLKQFVDSPFATWQRKAFALTVIVSSLKVIAFLIASDSFFARQHNYPFFVLFYIVVWLSFSAIVFSPMLVLGARRAKWYAMLASAFLSLVIVSDLVYYRAYSNFLTVYSLGQGDNLENLWTAIASLLHWSDVLFVLDLAALAIVLRPREDNSVSAKGSWSVASSTIVLSIGILLVTNFIHEKARHAPLFMTGWNPNETMYKLSPIGYHFNDLLDFWSDRDQKLSSADSIAIEHWFRAHHPAIDSASEFGRFKNMNLLCIQVESLESFVLDQSIDGQEICPELNALTRRSTVFPSIIEQINNGGSSDCDLMLNTSVYPPRKGSVFFRFANNRYESLPTLLAKHGYESVAIKGEKPSYFNWKAAFQSMGFNRCIDRSQFDASDAIGLSISDSSMLHQSVRFIREARQPWYSVVVTLTSHCPFELPARMQHLRLPKDLQQSHSGAYLQAVHYTDHQIGAFLRELDTLGLLDNTVVMIYGDHCGLHRYYIDEADAATKSYPWMNNQLRTVPLIVYQKHDSSTRKVYQLGGTIDIYPTALCLLGVGENEARHAMGRNLFAAGPHYCFNAAGQCFGDTLGQNASEHAREDLNIADKIVTRSYFGRKTP